MGAARVDRPLPARRYGPRPVLHEPLTSQPIVRFIGADDPAVTSAGVAQWTPILAEWLLEGRTPTVFLHTPDNSGTPALALALHAELARSVPGLAALPEPLPLVPHDQGSLL